MKRWVPLCALLASCGAEERWVRVVVEAEAAAVPLVAGRDLDAVTLVLAPEGCDPKEETFPTDTLPQDVVVVLSEACEASTLTATATALRGEVAVAESGEGSAEVGVDGGELRLTLARLCADGDGDGHGDGPGCLGLDCDDGDASVHPGAPERCNGEDDDCDGQGDLPDGDGDGVRQCDGDCNDQDPAIHPGHEELCDGVDEDCDGSLTASCVYVKNGDFEDGLDGWIRRVIDTQGAEKPAPGIFDEPAVVEGEPGASGKAIRVATHAPGDYDGLVLCSTPFRLEAGVEVVGRARVKVQYADPTKAAWAVARLVQRDLTTLNVGPPQKTLPHDEWGEVTVTHTPPEAIEARLCLLYRSIRDADQGGPTATGTAMIWDDVALGPP